MDMTFANMTLKEFEEWTNKIKNTYFAESVARLHEDDTAADDQQDSKDASDSDASTGGDDTSSQEPENPVATDLAPGVESDEQVELNNDIQQQGAPMKMPTDAPIPTGTPVNGEGAPLQLADGTETDVAQDSSLQYDAINPQGEATITFQKGNFNQMTEMPQKINQKIATIQKTIMPLVEVGLLELLGNNKAYKGENFNAVFNMLDQEPKFEVNATYSVEMFIGTDIDKEDIQHDAKYILDRVKVVPDVQWNKCEIDCTNGKVNLGFIV